MEAIANTAETAWPAELGASTQPYLGAVTPALFGDVDSEFTSALTQCCVADQGWRVRMRVTGGDAQRWLNGMLTNTAALAPGTGNYNLLLSAQGRLQGDACLFRVGDSYVLETNRDQQQRLMEWLNRYIIMDDVQLAADTTQAATLAVVGPQAAAVLQSLGVDADGIAPLTLAAATIAGCNVTLVRNDASAVPFYSLWHDAADSLTLWHALPQAGAAPAGCEAIEMLRIASGTPLFGVDLHERDLPQETAQQRALHFSKGCYIGQEIVERIHSRGNVHRGWRGFAVRGENAMAVAAGCEITSDDSAIGTLTSVATLPLPSGIVRAGLGIVRLQPVEESKPIYAAGCMLQPVPLPFK